MKFERITNEIRDAFREAFPASLKDEFALVIRDAYLTDGRRQYTYDDFSEGTKLYEMVIQKTIDWAESANALVGLIDAATKRRPDVPLLKKLAAKLKPLQQQFEFLGADLGEAERIVLKGVVFEDVMLWLPRLIRARNAVCRFEPQPPKTDGPGSDVGYGSGFLIAPNVVMTADHNIVNKSLNLLNDQAAAKRLRLRFDHYVLPDKTVNKGIEHQLADDWLILRSPEDELDFALLRLAKSASEDLVEDLPRGFLKLEATSIVPPDPLFILQHPGMETPPGSNVWRSQPMKLSFGAVDRRVSTSRVGYKVNTNPGSSGSPCLTQDLRAVAIHHFGTKSYNQAVSFEAIFTYFQTEKVKDVLVKAGLGFLIGIKPDPQPQPKPDPKPDSSMNGGESIPQQPKPDQQAKPGGWPLGGAEIKIVIEVIIKAFTPHDLRRLHLYNVQDTMQKPYQTLVPQQVAFDTEAELYVTAVNTAGAEPLRLLLCAMIAERPHNGLVQSKIGALIGGLGGCPD